MAAKKTNSTNHMISYLICSGLAIFAISCGGDEEEKEEPKTVYGNLVISDSVTEEDDGSVELTSATTCSLDSESDFLKVVLAGSKSKLIVKVQDAAAATFTCTQEDDGFESCLVYAEAPAAAGAETSNGYSMAADADAGTTGAVFPYPGACTVTLTELSPSVEGSVSCAGMVQTKFEGKTVHPIQDDVTAAVTVEDFHCTPK